MKLDESSSGGNWYNESSMRAIDLYSGVGGWSLGLRMAGVKVVRSFEWWKEANATHNGNFGTDHREVDIRQLRLRDLDNLGKIDIVVGSPPCTQFSFSNRGGSGNIKDGLVDIKKFLDVVEYLEPRYWAMENVPRVANILKECIQPGGPLERYRKLVTVIKVVDAADYGVPQNRKRMIAGNFPAEIFFQYPRKIERRTLRDVVESLAADPVVDPVYGFRLKRNLLTDHEHETPLSSEERRLNDESKRHHPVYNGMQFPDSLDRPSRTVTATCTRVSRESIVIKDPETSKLRRLTVRERASVQAFPISFQFYGASYSNRLRMAGNAVPPLLTYFIAQSMRRVSVEKAGMPPKLSGAVHPLPATLPIRVPPETKGVRYPDGRRFRAALHGFRFGSGVRFELSNVVGDTVGSRWALGCYHGHSKDIKAVRLDSALEKRCRAILDAPAQIKIDRILAPFLSNIDTDIHELLQAAWSHKNSGIHPFGFLDDLAKRMEEVLKIVEPTTACAALVERELFPAGRQIRNTGDKFTRNYCRFFVGMLVASRVNVKLFGEEQRLKTLRTPIVPPRVRVPVAA